MKLGETTWWRVLWQRVLALTVTAWLEAAVGVWFLLAGVLLVVRQDGYGLLSFGQDIPWGVLLAVALLGFLSVALLAAWFPSWRITGRLVVASGLLLAFLLALRADSGMKYYLFYSLALMIAVLLYYAAPRGLLSLSALRPGRRTAAVTVGVLFLVMAAVIGLEGVARHLNFVTPNFDFGLFCQMFHNMKETGLPMTTCERDRLLSHFAVHISPVFYLLLPVYMVFPSPLTLLIAQGVVVASGIFPLYLLARKLGLGTKVPLAAALCYAAYPALSTGCLYDLHENCFLAPLLLWMFCAYEYKRPLLTVVAALLVLSVKEDAAVYVALFAVYILLSRKDWRRGLPLLGAALLWFGTALVLLHTFGEGSMVGRYAAYQYGDSGLLGVIKTLIVNPGYFLRHVLYGTESNATAKLRYLAQMVVPLGLALFTGRRFVRYLLILPVFLNLLSNWPYQYNITFQYSFGVSAFFLYLCLLNLRDMPPARRRAAAAYAACVSVLMYVLVFAPQVKGDVKSWQHHAARAAEMTAVIDTIPDDASVTCSTFLLPHLAQRAVVYEDHYHQTCDTEYLVLDLRPGYRGDVAAIQEKYEAAGYTVTTQVPDAIMVMRRGE